MSDQNLRQIVGAANPVTISEVITLMDSIGNELTNDDGLKWFNFLYLAGTREVQDHPPAGGWRNPAWLARLDVVFAKLSLTAIAQALDGDSSLPAPGAPCFRP